MAHLAGLDELGHRADGLLDRDGLVDAVLVVEIDVVDAEPLEARVAGLPDVVGVAANAEALAVLAADVAELRREHDLVAAAAIARPTSCSFVNGPYMSAVSKKVTPSSSARLIVAIASASSAVP